MIRQIHLQQVVPAFLEEVPADKVHSEVWRSDLLFEKGQSYLVRADSGKGKTTLCSYLYGLRRDYTGTITFDGTDIRKFSHRQWSRLRRESFGQKQRVAFIRMLCQAADFLVMDEPVSHLDDTNSQIMADMLHERISRDGAGLIVTSIGRDLPYDYNRIVHL